MTVRVPHDYSATEWEALSTEQKLDSKWAEYADELAGDMNVPIEAIVRAAEREVESR